MSVGGYELAAVSELVEFWISVHPISQFFPSSRRLVWHVVWLGTLQQECEGNNTRRVSQLAVNQ